MTDWERQAYCAKHYDPELAGYFFRTSRDWQWPHVHNLVWRTCRLCPVREECLAFGLETQPSRGLSFGVWGGLSVEQRELVRSTGKTCTCDTKMACYVHVEPVRSTAQLAVENILKRHEKKNVED